MSQLIIKIPFEFIAWVFVIPKLEKGIFELIGLQIREKDKWVCFSYLFTSSHISPKCNDLKITIIIYYLWHFLWVRGWCVDWLWLRVSQRLQLGTGSCWGCCQEYTSTVAFPCNLGFLITWWLSTKGSRERRREGERERGKKRGKVCVAFLQLNPRSQAAPFQLHFIKEFTKILSSSKRENKKSISCWRYANSSS